MIFKQYDTNLNRFNFFIEETGLKIIKKGITASSETFVEFEDIGSKIIKEKSRKLSWLLLSILFFVIAIAVFISRIRGIKVDSGAEIFHLSVSLFFFIIYLLTKKSILYLAQPDNTNAVGFIDTKKYAVTLEQFIKQLTQTRDNYLIKKYATLDDFLPYSQQYNNLVWLYNLGLLTKEQLQSKIAELDKSDVAKDSSEKFEQVKITGFSNRNN